MKHYQISKLSIFLISMFFVISFNSYITNGGNLQVGYSSAFAKGEKTGPPQHAKAHGYRAKHQYRYYPSASAYYDVERKAYFYLEGDNWRMGVSLPDSLSVSLGRYVTVEMESDRPYTGFEEHKRQYGYVK
jgi:hypothetical protein